MLSAEREAQFRGECELGWKPELKDVKALFKELDRLRGFIQSDQVFQEWGNFRKDLRQLLFESGVRSNPGWTETNIIKAFEKLLEERQALLQWRQIIMMKKKKSKSDFLVIKKSELKKLMKHCGELHKIVEEHIRSAGRVWGETLAIERKNTDEQLQTLQRKQQEHYQKLEERQEHHFSSSEVRSAQHAKQVEGYLEGFNKILAAKL